MYSDHLDQYKPVFLVIKTEGLPVVCQTFVNLYLFV